MNNLIISRNNYEKIDYLNSLLKDAKIDKKITMKIIDTTEEFGVKISIPSIMHPEWTPYEVDIIERFKEVNLSILQLIDSINNDIEDLFRAITPDFIRLTRIRQAFNYSKHDSDLDNSLIINFNLNENYYRLN